MNDGYGYGGGRGGGNGRGCGMGQGMGRGMGQGMGRGGATNLGQRQGMGQGRDVLNRLGAIASRIADLSGAGADSPVDMEGTSEVMSDKEPGTQRTVAVIDQEQCANCGLCIQFCPEGAIRMNGSGIVTIAAERCTGCASCIDECPSAAITLSDAAQCVAS